MSNTKKRRKHKSKGNKFGKIFLGLVLVLVAVLIIGVFGVNTLLKKKTGRSLLESRAYCNELVQNSNPSDFKFAQNTYIYSDDGTKIAQLAEDVDATWLKYDAIPAEVVQAFVAVEDRSYWDNNGISYKGLARVAYNFVRTHKLKEGASTITQQFARGAFLSQEKTVTRKINEIFIALALTDKYSKQDIMEFYCNTCCFANGIYGVEDASQKYFGKSVNDLDLSEVAYICSIPNRPEYFNPLKYPENAISRRDKILEDMYECGYITESEMKAAKAEKIEVASVKEKEEFHNYEVTYAINSTVKYFMELGGFEFRSEFSSDEDYQAYQDEYKEFYTQAKHNLYTGGYKVYTTMNLDAQKALQAVVDDGLAFSDEKTEEGIYKLQGAMTVIDNETGKVVAMVGGRSQPEISNMYSLNRGFQGFAQPGSSIKPLVVYGPALENGYHEDSILTEIDVKIAQKSNATEISKMTGPEMTLRSAVENSKNGCAYWLYNNISPKYGLSHVTDMDFSKIVPNDYTLSSGLGGLTYGVSTLEMANAYSTLENHGAYTKADCIKSIVDSNGNEIYTAPESKQVYTVAAADEMTDILKGVLTVGTAKGMGWYNISKIEAAGKTGTTNDCKAGWFCGYTPYYSIAVWVGCDNPVPVDGLYGSSYPASLWKAAMFYMTRELPYAEFKLEGTYHNTTTEDVEPEEEVVEDPLTEEAIDGIVNSIIGKPEDKGDEIEGNTGNSDINGNVPGGTVTKPEEKPETKPESGNQENKPEDSGNTDAGNESDTGADNPSTDDNVTDPSPAEGAETQ